jgi:hypothetical protein
MIENKINERSWLDILQQSMTAFLTWPRKEDKGNEYKERFSSFSEFLKITPMFIFNDDVFSRIAPSVVFTDGVNIYLHEQVINECWDTKYDDDAENFKPIYNVLMKSVAWVLDESQPDRVRETSWQHVSSVDFKDWVNKLKSSKQDAWLERIGIDPKSSSQSIEQTLIVRRDMVAWCVQRQNGKPEIVAEKSKVEKRPPVWMNEVGRIMRMRWDEVMWLWEDQSPTSYQKRSVMLMVAEESGVLIGRARNAAKESQEAADKIIKEGWDPAVRGWVQALRAMIVGNDWVSFGRSMMAFAKESNESETLSFEEKSEITNIAAAVFQEISHKEAWVDILSGRYECWQIGKTIKQDVSRFWKSIASNDVIEAVAFYNMLPDSRSDGYVKKDFILLSFQELLDKIPVEQKQQDMINQGFNLLQEAVRGVEAKDAILLIDKWREWSEDRAPEWFDGDDDDFDNSESKYKIQIEDLLKTILRARKWSALQKKEVEEIMLDT